MQIVIDIPEDVYKRTVFYREFRNLSDCVATIKALERATLLPKGHGRLIDADEFQMKCFRRNFSNQIDNHEMADINMLLHLSPTIIPAEEVQE